MKHLVAMILGIAGGAMGTWLLMDITGDEAGTKAEAEDVSAPKYARLLYQLEVQTMRLKEVERELDDLNEEKEAWLAKEESERAKVADGEKKEKNLQEAMGAWGRLQAQSEDRELREILGLNSVQLEAFEKVMASLQKERKESYAKMFSGQATFRDFAVAEGAMPQVDEFAAEYLNDEQMEAYEEYKAKREGDRIERSANEELIWLQSMVSLSEDQKDAAFNVFAEMATRETPDKMLELESNTEFESHITEAMEPRKQALSEILTPEQHEVYIKQSEVWIDMAIQMTGGKPRGKVDGNE